jgi:16S rRNA (cytidine1402-2'-O)-methyltransferase
MKLEASRRGTLVVVGTPIGNLEDLSPRAQETLARADAIFCEDTRVTAKIAARFGVGARRLSCPGHREKSRVAELLGRLSRGETVALVSDAGMPALSDPGEHLVAAAVEAGFRVAVVPGPSAPAAALAVSGLPGVPHLFLGFLPARAGERRRFLEGLRERRETLVWFEAPHRLSESLAEAARTLGSRRACVARELTKLHEEALHGTLAELAGTIADRGESRGEITVVVEGSRVAEQIWTEEQVDAEIERRLRAGQEKSSLAREMAARTGRPRREIYARALRRAAGRESPATGSPSPLPAARSARRGLRPRPALHEARGDPSRSPAPGGRGGRDGGDSHALTPPLSLYRPGRWWTPVRRHGGRFSSRPPLGGGG